MNEFNPKRYRGFIVVSVRTGVVGGVEKYTRNEGERGRVSVSPQAMDRRKKMYEIPAPPSRFSPPLK